MGLEKNVKIELIDGKIIITLDAGADFGLSSSGKSRTVASTGGFIAVPGTAIKINVNAIKPVR